MSNCRSVDQLSCTPWTRWRIAKRLKYPLDFGIRGALERFAVVRFGIKDNGYDIHISCGKWKRELAAHLSGVLIGIQADEEMNDVARQSDDRVNAGRC